MVKYYIYILKGVLMKRKYQVIIGLLLSMTAFFTLSCSDVVTGDLSNGQGETIEVFSSARAIGDKLIDLTKNGVHIVLIQTSANQVTLTMVSNSGTKYVDYTLEFIVGLIPYNTVTGSLTLYQGVSQSITYYYPTLGYVKATIYVN